MHSIDIKNIQWPAKKLSIGDVLSERIVYQVGTEYCLSGVRFKVSSIIEEKNTNSYIISISTQGNSVEEKVWKVIKNPSKMVEIEYDIDAKAYPDKI
jgi:hypothetical protein